MTLLKLADPDYRALDRQSYSSLKMALLPYKKYIHERSRAFSSSSMNLGTAIHHYLQGNEDLVVFEPDLTGLKTKTGEIAKEPRMTNEGKKILADFYSTVPADKMVVPFSSRLMLEHLKSDFFGNKHIKEKILGRLDNSLTECCYLGEIDDLPLKCKVDGTGDGIIVDYKSTHSAADKFSFLRTIEKYHYFMQAAIYRELKAKSDGVSPESIDYYMVAFETEAPHEIYPYKLSEESIRIGMFEAKKAIERYKLYQSFTSLHHYNDIQEL